jgi:hypothetical protein
MRYIFIILLAMLASCNYNDKPEPIGNVYEYTVKAGEHYSTHAVNLLDKDMINFSFTTDSSWVWEVPELNGYSKVVGIAWGTPHQNSVRVVYARRGDIGVLAYYYYINGISPMENNAQWGVMDTIEIGKTYYGRLGWSNGFYYIQLGNKYNSLKVYEKYGVSNLLHPFIGGTYTIDHDWTTTQRIW